MVPSVTMQAIFIATTEVLKGGILGAGEFSPGLQTTENLVAQLFETAVLFHLYVSFLLSLSSRFPEELT